MYTPQHIDKIGNTIVFLASRIKNISKTKLLKLLYILDEISIKKSGIPFLNLEYKVWKFGPVASELFVEFSSSPSMLKDYIIRKHSKGHDYIVAKKEFNDDEFTQNEIELLEFVVERFNSASADDLIDFTHRKLSPWYNAANRHSVYHLLQNESISTTDYKVNMKELIDYDERKKSIYEDFIEQHGIKSESEINLSSDKQL